MVDRTQRLRAPALPTKREEPRVYASDYPERSEGATGMEVAAEGYELVERNRQGRYGYGGSDIPRGAEPVYDGPDVPYDERRTNRVVY